MSGALLETPRVRHRRGVSLVETIVIAGLISTVLLLVIGLLPSFKLANRRATLELQAAAITQSALERARSTKFNDLVSATDTFNIDGVNYTQTTTVTTSPSGLSKTIVVELSWAWSDKTFTATRQGIICRVPRG